jgi:hypothetical protein
VLGSTSLFATHRWNSATAYTRCPDVLANVGVLSGQDCLVAGESRNEGRLPTFKQIDLRVTRGFMIGAVDLTAYLDVRNLLDAVNLLRVFAVTGGPASAGDRQNFWATDSSLYSAEARENGLRGDDGEIDLRFSGQAASGCGNWKSADAEPAVPSCVYLVRAEERYGNGDHRYTVEEQRRASAALYAVNRGGRHRFGAEPRRARLGLEMRF